MGELLLWHKSLIAPGLRRASHTIEPLRLCKTWLLRAQFHGPINSEPGRSRPWWGCNDCSVDCSVQQKHWSPILFTRHLLRFTRHRAELLASQESRQLLLTTALLLPYFSPGHKNVRRAPHVSMDSSIPVLARVGAPSSSVSSQQASAVQPEPPVQTGQFVKSSDLGQPRLVPQPRDRRKEKPHLSCVFCRGRKYAKAHLKIENLPDYSLLIRC